MEKLINQYDLTEEKKEEARDYIKRYAKKHDISADEAATHYVIREYLTCLKIRK